MEDYTFTGSQFKVAIEIDNDTFDIDTDDWSARVCNGNRVMYADRNRNTFRADDGTWYVLVDTDVLGSGQYTLVVDVEIPDTDFAGSMRHETYKTKLIPVYPVHPVQPL